MSAREMVRCDRCRRTARSGRAARENWNAVTRRGLLVGLICNGCQTVEEHTEAEINLATIDYGATPDGRLTGTPKGTITKTPEVASNTSGRVMLARHHEEHGHLLSAAAVSLLVGVDVDAVREFMMSGGDVCDVPEEWAQNGNRRREIAEAAMQQDDIAMLDSLIFWASVDHGKDVFTDGDRNVWMVDAE